MNSEKLILALDVESLSEAERMVDILKERVSVFKIGLQLFTKEGPKAVNMVHQKGGRVFLDLKYHDIPNTVAKAAIEATRLGVFMFSIHALGGDEMMKRCKDSVVETSLKDNVKRPMVIAVTILTSIDQKTLNDLGMKENIKDKVRHLSEKALRSGLDGIVASPEEVKTIRECCGKDFIIVTPGIRPEGKSIPDLIKDDQKRFMTPKEAIREGANYLVIGRPVVLAEDPLKTVEGILKDIS